MAITNAQQYQQLVKKDANGKRPGYRGDAAYRSYSAQSTGSQRGSATKSELGGGKPSGPSLRDDPNVKQNVKDSRDDEIFQKRRELKKEIQRQEEEKAEEKVERFRNKQFKGLPFPGVTSLLNPLFKRGMTVNRNFFLDKVLKAGRLGNLTPEEFANLSLSEQEAAYKDYMSNRLAGKTDAYGNPTRGFSYDSEGNLVGNFIDDNDDNQQLLLPQQPQDPTNMLPQINPIFYRFMADGGMTNDAPMMQGGITDLALRDEFFLGGIVKGIKKGLKGVTRAVKKVAKSPIGKAALLAGVAGIPFGGGSFFGQGSLFGKASGLLKSQGLKDFFFKDGVPGFKNLSTAGIITPLLAAPFIGELLGLNKQDEQVVDRGPGLDFNAQQFYRLAADGGLMRQQYQEGSKEPVAKKTMPLIDMGGKEKDYRETGGFVDMGRMERADDVPARLSKNEFVFTAEAVRNAGDGDVDKGSEVMYNMMKNLESGGDVSEESQGLDGARKMFQTSQRLGEVI
jgi:hypothetical protein